MTNMANSVSFKAYLKRDGKEVEVRRFGIDGGAATNFMYLRGKIQTMFPSLQNDQFSVFWQDSDKDYVTIDSDEELMVALTADSIEPLKLYIHVKPQSQAQGGGSNRQTHPNITCDGCEGPVTGYRYKCVTCPDFDLCAGCEAQALHPEHFMIRMPTPLGPSCHPKLFRKFFGRPHKFHKRHGWNRMGEGMFGEFSAPGSSGGCPFTRREGPAPPMPPTTGGVGDMFDFSALLDFINSLGVVASGESAANETRASAQAGSSTQAQPGPAASSQPGPAASSQPNPNPNPPTNQAPQASEYLTNIGQAIAAFLDPFGVDVTFDVRPPTSSGTSQAPAAPPPQQPTPTTAPPTTSISTPISVPTPTSVPTPISVPTPTSVPAPASAPVPTASPRIEIPVSNAIPLPAPFTSNDQPREGSATPVRRNSDDWTLLNRESPVRGEAVAMEVEETRGAKPKAPPVYPELPKETPSAPPQVDNQYQRIQDAIRDIRSMGFNVENAVLGELLRRENGDVASVLEMILNNSVKK